MNDTMESWHFPVAGIDLSYPFSRQQPRRIGGKSDYGRTCRVGINVRGYEYSQNRKRGGSRFGISKYIPVKVTGRTFITQNLSCLVTTGNAVQTNAAGRVVYLVAVSEGNVKVAVSGDTSWTTPTNETGETPALIYSGIMFSAANGQKLYFADGTNEVYFDPAAMKVKKWVAKSPSILPRDAAGNRPRLITTWRGRTVVSGLLMDPHNWFMSAVDDPTDFDYSPPSQTPTQAIAGNNAPQGLIGDLITGLCSYTDDVLIFFGDHSVYMMRGDPFNGGQIDKVTDAVGAAWGEAFCMDPYGTVYFFSNRCGIYSLVPGQKPLRISQPIESFVQDIDTGNNSIRLIWNDRQQGFHTFITNMDAPTATTHLFWEMRTGAWWMDQFANNDHDPVCCCTFDGNDPSDRVNLIGSWDGYVRALDHTAEDDDGTDIESQVVIGPLVTKDLDELMLLDMQAVMGETSATVNYAIHVGETAEAALEGDPVEEGTWLASRNDVSYVQSAGYAVYVKITCSSPWALEQIRLRVAAQGKVRQRGR